MDDLNDMLDMFYKELRQARRELNEYRALPSDKRNENKLQKLREKYEALEEIDRQL